MQNINNFQSFFMAHPMAIALFVTWSIVWKGFALWKAGRNNSPIWFVALLLVNTLGLLEIIYLFAIKNASAKTESNTSSVKTEVETETKMETVVEEKKEDVPTLSPVIEVKHEEINHEEIKAGEVKEEIKQEINQ